MTNSVLGKTPEAAAFWALLWKREEECSEALRNGFSPLYALDDGEVLEAWPNPHRQGNISREQGKIAALFGSFKRHKPVPGNGMKLKNRIWKAISYFEVMDEDVTRRSSAQTDSQVTPEQILGVLVRIETKICRIEQHLGLDRAAA